MTRSARRRDGLSPSLFPFLAVLLCTMGALVLILMLSVSGAQNSAQQMVTELKEQVELEEAKLQFVKRGLTEKLEEVKVEVEKKRLALQHLEEHIRELTEELEHLLRQKELVDAAKESNPADSESRAELISELEKQLAEATKQLQQKLDDPQGDKPIFAIIPYDGPNGTHRRPIYLECTARGVVIQPEGVLISPSDLRPPYGPGNPLDAALRAIRAEFPSNTGSVTSSPYPLLVVRPSGIKHYMMARAAMTGWDDQFGYELVSEELDLAYPPSLPHLPEKIAQALDLARQRQAALIKAMPQHYAGLNALTEDLAYISEGETSGEFTGRHPDSLFQEGEGQSDFNSNSSNTTATRPAAFAIGSSSSFPQGKNLPAVETGAGQGAWHRGNGSASVAESQQLGQTASITQFGNSNVSTEAFGQGNSTGNGSSDSPGGYGGDSNMASAASVSSQQTQLPGSFASKNLLGGSADQSLSGSMNSSMSNSTVDQTNSDANQARNGTTTGSMGATSLGNMTASAGQGAGDCDQNCQNLPMDPHQPIPPNLNVNLSRNQVELVKPVAMAKGANWAWDRPQRTQTAVVRAIRLRCYLDRWEVLPEKGSNKNPVIIRFEGSPAQRAEELAKVVRQRVESWGVALSGGHWTPSLHVDVASGAEWRFTQLQRLMEGSGIDVQKKNTISP